MNIRDVVTREQFSCILPKICDQETSASPELWTPACPLWGHCAVVALLAQDVFGGKILRFGFHPDSPFFKSMGSHYWNQFADGTELDFTRGQFGENYPPELIGVVREREYLLSSPTTAVRYNLLLGRFHHALKQKH
jgi:hypothetical protein